jgi:hypothetical protein
MEAAKGGLFRPFLKELADADPIWPGGTFNWFLLVKVPGQVRPTGDDQHQQHGDQVVQEEGEEPEHGLRQVFFH